MCDVGPISLLFAQWMRTVLFSIFIMSLSMAFGVFPLHSEETRQTRMHSSKMRTARVSGHLSCTHASPAHPPTMHIPTPTMHIPTPTTYVPCHICLSMHNSCHAYPLAIHTPTMHVPAMHAPCYAHPSVMHAPHHICPHLCTPYCHAPLHHAYLLPCIPPVTHVPVWTDICQNITFPQLLLRAVKTPCNLHSQY